MTDGIRRTFPGISSRAWEHPADRAALGVLRQAGDLSRVSELLTGITQERQMRLWHLGAAIRVSADQLPKLHEIEVEVCGTLDIKPVPELFVMQQPILNAGALGARNPFIVLTSGAVAGLGDPQLRAMIGHELGHIKSGHAPLKTLLALLLRIAATVGAGAIPQLLIQGLVLALLEWDRKSELSADRAGLLACQDVRVAQGLLMRTAGGTLEELRLEPFAAQAQEYENSSNILDSVAKVIQQLGLRHPMTAVRFRELETWAERGEYRDILEGHYPREGDPAPDVNEEIKKAGEKYREDVRESQDPLARIVGSVGKGIEEAGKQVQHLLDELFGSRKP
jgi:Zn-dependent protease with chaperone function